MPIATKNREMLDAVDTYAEVVVNSEHMFDMDLDIEEYGGEGNGKSKSRSFAQAGAGAGPQGAASDSILDIREYDVPYYLRVAIDKRECWACRIWRPQASTEYRSLSLQTSALDCGTTSLRTMATSKSRSSSRVCLEPNLSCSPLISKQQKRHSNFLTRKQIKS